MYVYYVHLAFVRFEHSLCRGPLMTNYVYAYTYIYIYKYFIYVHIYIRIYTCGETSNPLNNLRQIIQIVPSHNSFSV